MISDENKNNIFYTTNISCWKGMILYKKQKGFHMKWKKQKVRTWPSRQTQQSIVQNKEQKCLFQTKSHQVTAAEKNTTLHKKINGAWKSALILERKLSSCHSFSFYACPLLFSMSALRRWLQKPSCLQRYLWWHGNSGENWEWIRGN